MSYVFEQSGRQIQADPAGLWIASLENSEQEKIIEKAPNILKEWDKNVGDRIIKIVFIGKYMDKEAIIYDLDKCLQ